MRGVRTNRPNRSVRLWGWLAGLLMALAAGPPGCGDAEEPPAQIILRFANRAGAANDPNFLRLEREIREGFERQHPGVRLRIEPIPGHGQYEPKLLLMMASGNAPDILELDASSAAVFINNETLLDLAPFMSGDEEFSPEGYFPEVYRIAQRGDAVYGVPLDFTPMVMFYNKRIFDEAGVPYPQDGWSWGDFLDACQRLTVFPPDSPAPQRYGFNFQNWMPGWVPWLWLSGGDVLSPDGRHAVGWFDGPQSMEAIRFLVDLIREHRAAPSLRESAAAGIDLFRAGRAAMHLTGHWSLIEYRSDGMDIGVVGLPTNTGKQETVIYCTSLAVTRDTKHPQLAWEFVKYMTSTEVQIKRVSTGLAISANRAAAEHYATNPQEAAFLAQVKHARAPWGARVERYPFCEDLGREMFEDILNAGVPVEQAVRRTARLIEAGVAER